MNDPSPQMREFLRRHFRGILGEQLHLANSMLILDGDEGKSGKEAIDDMESDARSIGVQTVVRMTGVSAEQFRALMDIRSDVVQLILLDQIMDDVAHDIMQIRAEEKSIAWGNALIVCSAREKTRWSRLHLLHQFDVAINVGPNDVAVLKNRVGPITDRDSSDAMKIELPWCREIFPHGVRWPVSIAIVDDNGGMRGTDMVLEIERAAQRLFDPKSIVRVTGAEVNSIGSIFEKLEVPPRLLLLDQLPMARAERIAGYYRRPIDWRHALAFKDMGIVFAVSDEARGWSRLFHDVDVLLSVDQRSVSVPKNRFGPSDQLIQRVAG